MIQITEKEIMSSWKNTSDLPLVTIRCLAYNHEQYISDALDGFLIQKTNFPFEIFIHDDASTDNTAKIIKQYQNKFPNIIRAIYETENQYSKHDGSLRRIMDENMRGKYVAYCEGDDYWISPNKLQRQINYLIKKPQCSMVFHAVNYEKRGKIIGNDRRFLNECNVSAQDIIEGGGLFCATASLCVRTKDLFIMPRYRKIALNEDYPLQVMLATKGEVHYFPEIMGVYRVSTDGSWTERTHSSESKVYHARNGIEWLNEFNKDTGRKYARSIEDRVVNYRIMIYSVSKEYRFFGVLFNIIQLKKKRLYYLRILVKVFIGKHFPLIVKKYRTSRGRV